MTKVTAIIAGYGGSILGYQLTRDGRPTGVLFATRSEAERAAREAG